MTLYTKTERIRNKLIDSLDELHEDDEAPDTPSIVVSLIAQVDAQLLIAEQLGRIADGLESARRKK